MGGKSSAPNPQQVAQAQTASNIQTAIANAYINNPNVTNPFGSTTSKVSGYKSIFYQGKEYKIPQFDVTQTLNADQQHLLNLQNQTGANLGQAAVNESNFLTGFLPKQINTNQLPDEVRNAPNSNYNQIDTVNNTPNLQNNFNDAQRYLQTNFDTAGNVPTGPNLQNTFNDGQRFMQMDYGPANGYAPQRQEVEQALMSRLNPQIEHDQAALDQRLANQGISLGSEAYKRAQNLQGQNTNDLRMQAVLAGGQEQSRLAGLDQAQAQFANSAQAQLYGENQGLADFYNTSKQQEYQNALNQQGQQYAQNEGQAQFRNAAQQQLYNQNQGEAAFGNQALQGEYQNRLSQAGFNNQALGQRYDLASQQAQLQNTLRQQALQEDIALRNQPLSELSQLLHGSTPTVPQFQQFQGANIPPTPIGQYIYQSAAMNNQQNSAAMGGMFGLGSSLLGALPFLFSDERLKENIEHVGKTSDGQKIYSYNYKGSPQTQIGLMAQEVEKKHPEAVVNIGGYKAVDYAKALENA